MGKLALHVLRGMQRHGPEATVESYADVTGALATGSCLRCWEFALTLLHELLAAGPRKEGLEPTVVAFGAAITACKRGRQWQRALELLGAIQQALLELDVLA